MNIWDENQAPGSGMCLIYLHFLQMTSWYEEKNLEMEKFFLSGTPAPSGTAEQLF